MTYFNHSKNISHQLFYYKITFVNSQLEDTNSKGDFVLNKPVLNVRFKDFRHTKINLSQKYIFSHVYNIVITKSIHSF